MKLIPVIFGFFSTPLFYAAGLGHVKQTIISGIVKSSDDSSPLEGATITVKGTKNVTGTMPDGAFSLLVSRNDTVMIASLNGFETLEIKITKESFYEIILKHAGSEPDAMIKRLFHKQSFDTVNR